MEIVNVIAAAAASWIFGAAWYMTLSKPWVEVSGVSVDENGRPTDNSPLPFILSALCMILVAGMMRHMLQMTGVAGVGKSMLVGLGIGAFFIFPWVMINNAYAGRPFKLTIIDGGYAIFGCMIIGAVLALF